MTGLVRTAPLPLLVVSLLALVLVGSALAFLAWPAYAQSNDPPARPTGLGASVESGVGVNLTWDDPADATIAGYEILRRDLAVHDSGELETIESDTGGSDTAYTDATVEAGHDYRYRIKAINAHGTSVWSRNAPADVPDNYEPPQPEHSPADLAPANLTAALVEGGGVSLTWAAPAEETGSITGYTILRAVGGGELSVLVADTSGTATSYTDATATEKGSTYAYTVKALRDGEESQASNRAGVQVPHDPADLAPTNLTAVLVDGGGVSLNWDPPAEETGSVSGYVILRAQGEAELTVLVADTGNETTAYTDTTATEKGTTYAYTVKALRGQEQSQASNRAAVQVPHDPEDLAPTNLTAALVDGGNVSLTWDAPAEDVGSVTQYRVLRTGYAPTRSVRTASTDTAYTDSATDSGERYTYVVFALRDGEMSQGSNQVEVDIPAGPKAPANLTAGLAEGSGVSLDWDAPAEEAGTVTGYAILRAVGDGALTTLVADTSGTATSYTDATATEIGTTYTYRVRAWRGEEQSAGSNLAEMLIPHDPADLAPSNLTAQLVDGAGVSLAWDGPVEETGSVSGYVILRAEGEAELTVLVEDTGSETTAYTDTTATETGTTYVYQVKALRDEEQSEASNRAQVQIPHDPADLAPANLSAELVHGSISLDWDEPAGDAASVTGYQVSRQWSPPDVQNVSQYDLFTADGTATTWDDTAIPQAGVTYTYTVRAVRDGETSEWSNEAQVDVPGDAVILSGTNTITQEDPVVTLPGHGTGGELWSGHLTVGVLEDEEPGEEILGFDEILGGTLDDRKFSFRGAEYTIDAVEEDSGNSTVNLTLDRAIGDEADNLVFQVDDEKYDLADPFRVLAQGKQYSWRIDTTQWSENDTVELRILDLTCRPKNLRLTPGYTPGIPGSAYIKVRWALSNDCQGEGYSIDGYHIEVSTDGGTNWTDVISDTGDDSRVYKDENLTGGQLRHYRVTPVNFDGATSEVRTRRVPVDLSYYQGTMTVGEVTVGNVVLQGYSRVGNRTVGSLLPQPPTLTVEGVEYTIVELGQSASMLGLRIEPAPPSGLDFGLILNGSKYFTNNLTPHIDLGGALYRWSRNVPTWSAGQEVALTLKPTKKEKTLVWVSTFRVGTDGTNVGYLTGNYGAFSPNRFLVRDREFFVQSLRYENDPAKMRLFLQPEFPTDFTLRILGESYSSTDATEDTSQAPVVAIYEWSEPDTHISTSWPPRHASIEAEVDFLPEESVPSPPDLTATPDGTSTINLSWDPPDSDGGLPITGYQIAVSGHPAITNSWTVVVDNAGPTDRTYVHGGLEPGSTRYYRVQARNLRGKSEPAIIKATTGLDTNCDTYCATATVVEATLTEGDGIGFSTSALFSGSSINVNSFTLSGVSYTVTGLVNVRSEAFTGIAFRLNSLPPESAVAGLSLYVGGIEFPFSEAQRSDTATNKSFNWEDPVNFDTDNTIFTDDGTVDARIGSQFVNVVTIAADAATVDNDTDNIVEFTLTRTGSLANPLLVQMGYTELGADARACGAFAAGANTTAAKDWQFSKTAGTTVTFTVEPYPEDEDEVPMCNYRLPYAWPYLVGSPASATVTVVE